MANGNLGDEGVSGETRNRERITYVCAECRHEWTGHSHKGRRGAHPNVRLVCTMPKCACTIRLASVKRVDVTEEWVTGGWRYKRTVETRFEGVTPKVIA